MPPDKWRRRYLPYTHFRDDQRLDWNLGGEYGHKYIKKYKDYDVNPPLMDSFKGLAPPYRLNLGSRRKYEKYKSKGVKFAWVTRKGKDKNNQRIEEFFPYRYDKLPQDFQKDIDEYYAPMTKDKAVNAVTVEAINKINAAIAELRKDEKKHKAVKAKEAKKIYKY